MGSGQRGDEQSLLYREVGLRELTSADLIDAQLEAEKVVVQNGKAVAYTSDVLYGLNLLCRQMEYIGEKKARCLCSCKNCMSMISVCCKAKHKNWIWH